MLLRLMQRRNPTAGVGVLLRLMQRGNPTVVFSSLFPLCPALSSPTEVVEVMTWRQ